MDKRMQSALIQAVCKTFAEIVFIDVSVITDSPPEMNYYHILYTHITKPVEIKILLYLPDELKKIMSENIFNSPYNQLKTTSIDDLQMEMLNIITGDFLHRLFHDHTSFNFELPIILFDDEGIKRVADEYNEFFFNAEGIAFKLKCLINRDNKEYT